MKKERIFLSAPHMGGTEQKYIQEAFNENWIAPLGPNVNGLEQDLEKYLEGGKHVAALSSGTAAIHLALILLGVQRKDFVICQSLTFSASANPILYQGANPVFIDSEKETWNMCPEALETAIKGTIEKYGVKPKAIIGVHLYGVPYKADEINAIAKKYNIPVVEDAAEALGSKYKERACGTLGSLGILSFNGNKIITTSGGGALVCNTEQEKKRAIFFSTQSREDAPHYQHKEIGYNYRMSNIVAGIGRGQMEVLDEHVELRRKNYFFYATIFREIEGFKIMDDPNDTHCNHWLTPVLINPSQSKCTREELRLAFLEENIETRPLWKPMHLQPVFEKYDYYGENVAEELFEIGLCLPSSSNLTDEERKRIVDVINSMT